MKEERLSFLTNKYSEKLKPKEHDDSNIPQRGPGRRGPGGPGPGMKGAKPKNAKGTIKRLFSYLSKDKLKISFVVVCVLANTGLSLVASYMLRPIINSLTEGREGIPGLLKGIIMMALVYVLGIVCQYTYQRIMIGVSQNAISRLRDELFVKVQRLPLKYHDSNSNGDVMSRFTNDVDNVGEMLNNTIIQLISGLITLVGTFCLMLYTNWVLTIITVIMVPLMILALGAITKKSSKYYREQQAAIGTINGYIEETMNGQKVVKVFNHEEAAKEEFDYLNQVLKKKQINALFFGGIMGPVMGNMGQISYALTACVGGILCVARGFDVGGMTVFVNYSRQFSWPINQVAMQINTVFSALAGAERVFAIMDEEPEKTDASDAIDIVSRDDGEYYVIPDKSAYISEFGVPEDANLENGYYYKKLLAGVTLKDVSFGYVPEKTVLKQLNLYAKPGQKIAFVGSTGAGKTTITNLINRFYDIDEGQILIDGIPVNMLKRDALRRNVAMVLQDTHLFTGSIKDNIRYGRMDASDEEVIEAAKTASAHSFIMRLEDGYDTIITGDGANLSQGQRQLINIARAAISKAPILILDEATSSVDTRTERHIEHGMDRIMSSRTTLVIAHRLSTVRDSNAIMVLENGQIIERGDHDDLLEAKGRYYELYTGKSELT